MATDINARLQQQNRIGQIREYMIAEGKELRIRAQGKFAHKPFAISLLALGEKSSYRIHFSWGWLIIACLIGALLGGYYFAADYYHFSIGIYEFIIVGLAGLAIVACIIVFFLTISRKREFYSLHSHVALFDIMVNKPNSREYRAFLAELQACIVKAREFWKLKPDQQMAGELRMLRRLVEEGVLEQGLYDKAKERLFSRNTKVKSR